MKILSRLMAMLALVSLSQACLAAEPVEKKPEMKMGQPMKMDQPMGKMDESKMMEHLKMKQEHMLKMHDLSNQILTEKDAAKKESLKNQQLELMKAHHAQMMEHHQQKMQEHKK